MNESVKWENSCIVCGLLFYSWWSWCREIYSVKEVFSHVLFLSPFVFIVITHTPISSLRLSFLPSFLPCFLLSFPCFPFTLVCAAPHSPHISLPESPSLSVSLSLSCETSLYPSPLSISGSNTLLLSHFCLSLHICLSKHLPSHCLCISSHVWIKLFFLYI